MADFVLIAGTVWVAGIAAAGASVLLAGVVALAVLQLAMASSAKRVVVSYSTAIVGKVALATLASEYFPLHHGSMEKLRNRLNNSARR